MLLFWLAAASRQAMVTPVYTPIGDVICANFFAELVGMTATGTKKYETGEQNENGYLFQVDECETFHWGMGTTNENPVVLGPGDKLRLWIDDATTMEKAPNGIPTTAAKQLAQLANASGWIPDIKIYDRTSLRRCDQGKLFFNETESVWEMEVECGDVYEYEIKFGSLDGFFIHASKDPMPHTLVYAPVPSMFQLEKTPAKTFTSFKVAQNPCRPSLTARIEGEVLYMSPSYYDNYFKTNFTGVKDVHFIDNSIVLLKDTSVMVKNFMNQSQAIEVPKIGDQVRSPGFCSIEMLDQDHLGSSDVVVFANGGTKFQHLDLTMDPASSEVTLPNGETVVDMTATISARHIFFLLTKDANDVYRVRKWSKADGFTDYVQLTLGETPSVLCWSIYGYLLLLAGKNLYQSTDTSLRFTAVRKLNDLTEQYTFTSIVPDSNGRFLLQTDNNNNKIFLFSLDIPYVTPIHATFETGETIVANSNAFLLLGANGAKVIPVTSELQTDRETYSGACPISVTEYATLPARVILDKRDVARYKASVVSRDEHAFRMKKTPIFATDVRTTTFPSVKLEPVNTSYSPIVITQFEVDIRPLELGTGRLMIYTTGYGWICGLKSRVVDISVGCPMSRHLRIRGPNSTTVFYSRPYYKPIIDVYDDDVFLEEYTGKIHVSSDIPLAFIEKDEFLMWNTTNMLQVFDTKGPQRFTFTIDDDWSYCKGMSVSAEVSLETPRVPYLTHMLVGILFYLLLLAGVAIFAFVKRDELENFKGALSDVTSFHNNVAEVSVKEEVACSTSGEHTESSGG